MPKYILLTLNRSNRFLRNVFLKPRKKLQLCIQLTLLVVFCFYLYIHSSTRDNLEKSVAEESRIVSSNNISSKVKGFVDRTLITKTHYPLTLTAPYKIENPHVCFGIAIDILFVVHTATSHFVRRNAIRETYGNRNIFKTINTRIVFLVGTTNETGVADQIKEEHSNYADMVQGDFTDTYRNLTHKAVMGLRWVTEHCSHAKVVVKIDDDVFIDVFKLVDIYLPMFVINTSQVVCRVFMKNEIARGVNKWRIDDDIFRGIKYYPPYCGGFTVFTTPRVMKMLYRAAFITPFFWVDDVYVYGFLSIGQNIRQINCNDFEENYTICFAKSTKFVSCGAAIPKGMKVMWEHAVANTSGIMRRLINDNILSTFVSSSDI